MATNKRGQNGKAHKPRGRIRRFDPSDPRSLDHPSNREAFLKFMFELGRAMAAQDWEREHGKADK